MPDAAGVHAGAGSSREHAVVGATAASRSAGVEARGTPRFRTLYRRARFAGGIAFCVLSLGACLLVARRLSDASWPLEGAHVPLVFLAGGAYLASFGFRAFGWNRLFPSHERPDKARCLAACGAAAASGVVLPFRLDYVVKISTLRRLGGVSLGLESIAISIVALGMVDAVAMLPLAVSALATSGPVLRAPLIVVVLFCIGCLAILTLGQRVERLPVVGRSDRLHAAYRRAAETTRLTRSTFVAGLLLLGCWTSRTLGSTLLLSALGVGFSPTLALVVLCMSAATAILPITAGRSRRRHRDDSWGSVRARGHEGRGGQFRVGFRTPADQRGARCCRARTRRVTTPHPPRAPAARRLGPGHSGRAWTARCRTLRRWPRAARSVGPAGLKAARSGPSRKALDAGAFR